MREGKGGVILHFFSFSFLPLSLLLNLVFSFSFSKTNNQSLFKVAVLVNNAAIAFKGDTWGGDEAEETMNTNFRGTRRVTEALLPLMVEGGRVVNVCSRSGKLDRLFGGGNAGVGTGGGGGSGSGSPRSPRPPAVSDGCEVLRKKWTAAAEAGDFAAIDELSSEFVAAVREGTAGVAGWPRSMYGVSVRKEEEEEKEAKEKRQQRRASERKRKDEKPQNLSSFSLHPLFPLPSTTTNNRNSPRSATPAPSPSRSPRRGTAKRTVEKTYPPSPCAQDRSRQT